MAAGWGEESVMRAIVGVLLGLIACAVPVTTAASAPTAVPFEVVFDDVNPCTGLIHTVTISGTTFFRFNGEVVVATSQRTISTSPTGFVGHGTDTSVGNGEIEMFRLADILTNSAGDRIKAQFGIVVDVATGTVRVVHGGLTCLGPG